MRAQVNAQVTDVAYFCKQDLIVGVIALYECLTVTGLHMHLMPAGLHTLAFFCGTALLDLINVIARALVFAGVLTWMVRSPQSCPSHPQPHDSS